MSHTTSTKRRAPGGINLWQWIYPLLGLMIFPVGALSISPAAADAQARARYETQIALCAGPVGSPGRSQCIASAVEARERARGGEDVPETRTTRDGRATIVTPVYAPRTDSADADTQSTSTSPDGRATLITPGAASAPDQR